MGRRCRARSEPGGGPHRGCVRAAAAGGGAV